MTGWEFWAVAAALAAAVAAVLVAALRKAPQPETRTAEADLAVYKDQLAEIGRDLARGTIGPDEAARLRAEVGKRVIEADRARQAGERVQGGGPAAWVAVLILALVLPGGLAIYWWLGAPSYPDMALKPRLQALDAGIAARPSQADELARLNAPRDPSVDERLTKELAAATDPAALQDDFRARFEAGELQAAVRVQERILALKGDGASANDHANLALALVAEAQGYVSPEAEVELRASLERDMGNELARYLVGEMFLQGGRYDQTFRFWRPLAEGGMPGSPWVTSIRERIEQVAELAGVRYTLPAAAGDGPSAEDMAAAGEMSPEDRQAMIEGMVAQLNDRLASDGGTVEEWNKLIRSLAVLDRKDEAQKIYDEAKAKFEGHAAEMSFLKQAAVESGLQP
ncbi:MAG: c-type cytochrome biogenesis protein CcmI [Rhodobacterales bacterium]|nr:c-type cytochrome biogenesis protein CcmI [Rhodobacterales bacterium]